MVKSLKYRCEQDDLVQPDSYTHIDNGSDILAVAHVDYVNLPYHFYQEGDIVCCPRLDDRLGVWVILDLLPQLINVDVLLTTNEEIGQSTGQFFKPNKQYNWMFQFDRAGTDVVMYHYETPKLRRILQRNGFRAGRGSFSDISYMDLGCSGFNFGVGYHLQHTIDCYADLQDTYSMVGKFVKFYDKYKNKEM